MESILKNCQISKPFAYQAASTTDIATASIIDLGSTSEGIFDSVCFIVALGTVTTASVVTLKAYIGDNSALTDGAYATTTATVTASGTDTNNNVLILDCVRPNKRYARPDVVIDTANAEIECILAVRYNAKTLPTTELSSLADGGLSVNGA